MSPRSIQQEQISRLHTTTSETREVGGAPLGAPHLAVVALLVVPVAFGVAVRADVKARRLSEP